MIIDTDDELHSASGWLSFLSDVERSPNTVVAYGRRLAAYLSWTAQTTDWRSASLSHFAMWRRILSSPQADGTQRNADTVTQWLIPLRGFYEWAYVEGLIAVDVASRMTEMKYFPAGTPGGGEHGSRRKVLVELLRPAGASEDAEIEWISDSGARKRLMDLELRPRDRFLIDLLYYTGIRIGEALSLFTKDMHFGGGSPELDCMYLEPHFHVGEPNETENGARPKSGQRMLYVNERVVEAYVDYLIERARRLDSDSTQHVFANMYGPSQHGRAMTYSSARRLIRRCSRLINFPMTGPHVLRHTLATRLVRGIECEAVALDVVQEILGHADISSTRIYTHDLEAAKKSALQHLPTRTVNLEESA
ncbi:MAG: tyrosine-type recombinase/integrase [Leifsonia sp.]|uniref:tyrosine-type recombinase/integrase n=1 Tax=Leifsonia sp. TaxID=1870902 RepID=UPI003F816BB0